MKFIDKNGRVHDTLQDMILESIGIRRYPESNDYSYDYDYKGEYEIDVECDVIDDENIPETKSIPEYSVGTDVVNECEQIIIDFNRGLLYLKDANGVIAGTSNIDSKILEGISLDTLLTTEAYEDKLLKADEFVNNETSKDILGINKSEDLISKAMNTDPISVMLGGKSFIKTIIDKDSKDKDKKKK